jgi:hypothetical protein
MDGFGGGERTGAADGAAVYRRQRIHRSHYIKDEVFSTRSDRCKPAAPALYQPMDRSGHKLSGLDVTAQFW